MADSSELFVLPDFWLPTRARLNPHGSVARRHARRWARSMGILECGPVGTTSVWDDERYESADYALLSAYTHPQASRIELELVTDWYVWVFYFDDDFLERFKRSGDTAAAWAYLARLPAFMPVNPAPIPEPTNPVERGLADLWARTTPSRSRDWRSRFARNTKNLLNESMAELANIRRQRVPDPLEYIQMRRLVGGAPWSADIAEHAARVDLPDILCAARPLRVLVDTFADAVHLRNDIFSYEREMRSEGEINNCVLVTRQLMGCTLQQAVDLVNTLVTSRLRLFEYMASTELPALLDELLITPSLRSATGRYVQALRDWQSGCHEWHMRSGRYTHRAADRAPLSRSWDHRLSVHAVARADPPAGSAVTSNETWKLAGPFHMPYPARRNESAEQAIIDGKRWARNMRMLRQTNPSDPWNESTFDWAAAADFISFAGHAHPFTQQFELRLLTCWYVWIDYFDEFFTVNFKLSRDQAGARVCLDRLRSILNGSPNQSVRPRDAVEVGLFDLWVHILATVPEQRRKWLAEHILAIPEAWVWELRNIVSRRIPDPIDYLEIRRAGSGTDFALAMLQLARADTLPRGIFDSRPFQSLGDAFCDVGTMRNDIFCYPKKAASGQAGNSLVTIISNLLGCDTGAAIRRVNELVTSRLDRFVDLLQWDIPEVVNRLAPPFRAAAQDYFTDLKQFMAGDLYWELNTRHYWTAVSACDDTAKRFMPSRIGTSALFVNPSARN